MISDYDNENSTIDIPHKKPVTYTIHETYTLDKFDTNNNINVNYIDDKYFELRSPMNIATSNPYKLKIRDFVYRSKDYSEKAYIKMTDSYNVTYWPLKRSVDGGKLIRIHLDGNTLPNSSSHLEATLLNLLNGVIRPRQNHDELIYHEYNVIQIDNQYDIESVKQAYTNAVRELNDRLIKITEELNASLYAYFGEVTGAFTLQTVDGVITRNYQMRLTRFIYLPYSLQMNDDFTFSILGGNISLMAWCNGNNIDGFDPNYWELQCIMMFVPSVKLNSIDDNNNISDNTLIWGTMNDLTTSKTHLSISATINNTMNTNFLGMYNQFNTSVDDGTIDIITEYPLDDDPTIDWNIAGRIPGGSLFGTDDSVEDESHFYQVNEAGLIFNGGTEYDFNFIYREPITQFVDVPSNITSIVLLQLDTHIPNNLYLKMQGAQNSTETIACNNEKEHSKIKNFRVNKNVITCYLTESCNTKIPVSLRSITFGYHIAICLDWKYYKSNMY